jgi:hypothetical protein
LVCVNKGSEETPYNDYEKNRTTEPVEQKKLSVFPDFEEEFVPKMKDIEGSDDVSAILLEIAAGFQKLAIALKNK